MHKFTKLKCNKINKAQKLRQIAKQIRETQRNKFKRRTLYYIGTQKFYECKTNKNHYRPVIWAIHRTTIMGGPNRN